MARIVECKSGRMDPGLLPSAPVAMADTGPGSWIPAGNSKARILVRACRCRMAVYLPAAMARPDALIAASAHDRDCSAFKGVKRRAHQSSKTLRHSAEPTRPLPESASAVADTRHALLRAGLLTWRDVRKNVFR